MFYGAYNVENVNQGIVGSANNKRDANTAGGNKRRDSSK